MSVTPLSSTHPPLPPTTEDEKISRLRLLRSRRVGIATYYRLMSEHGSAKDALLALPEIARAAGVENYTPCPEDAALREMRLGQKAGARLIFFHDPDYPERLADLPDAPPFLWAKGDISLLNRPTIAVVGARNASSLGMRMARRLSKELAENGYGIVSGLARGIDTAAHQAALESGSIAVLAGGIDIIYPAENADLAANLARKGCLVAEQPPGTEPVARHFPIRNRVISGLAQAVVVVEAAEKSGSLITARNALDQGREVLAVPGHPIDARAGGCNLLIRDGATLIRNANDVIEALSPLQSPLPLNRPAPEEPEKETGKPLRSIGQLHRHILNSLGPSPLAEDQLIRDLKAPSGVVTPALTELELDGKILRHPGGLWARITA